MSERTYAIIPASEIFKLDFNEILQTSADTLRYSLDGLKIVIKWLENEPLFLKNIQGIEGPYDHNEIIEIMESPEWIDYSIVLNYNE